MSQAELEEAAADELTWAKMKNVEIKRVKLKLWCVTLGSFFCQIKVQNN